MLFMVKWAIRECYACAIETHWLATEGLYGTNGEAVLGKGSSISSIYYTTEDKSTND